MHLNLAYRWFCRLGLEGQVPDHSTFSKNRHGRFSESDVFRHLFELAVNRLVAVFGYVAASNPRTQFVVYSRGYFTTPEAATRFVAEAETRFPALRGRIQTFVVPGGLERATFRDPATATAIRDRVRRVLSLP